MKKYVKDTNHLKLHDKILPRCTSKAKYDSWRICKPAAGVAGFCEDCTPEFQKEKAAIGMCDHPEVLFYLDDDGLIYGSFKIHEEKRALVAK